MLCSLPAYSAQQLLINALKEHSRRPKPSSSLYAWCQLCAHAKASQAVREDLL